jgi:hypothetical protein
MPHFQMLQLLIQSSLITSRVGILPDKDTSLTANADHSALVRRNSQACAEGQKDTVEQAVQCHAAAAKAKVADLVGMQVTQLHSRLKFRRRSCSARG